MKGISVGLARARCIPRRGGGGPRRLPGFCHRSSPPGRWIFPQQLNSTRFESIWAKPT